MLLATSTAFSTFFKSAGNKAFVKTVLENIANGTAVIIPDTMEYGGAQTPVLLCRNPHIPPAPKDMYNRLPLWRTYTYHACLQDRRTVALFSSGNANIALCDPYWAIPTSPPAGSCYKIRRTNSMQFSRDGDDVADTRLYVLLHELAHYYIEAESKTSTVIDTTRVSTSIGYSADEAIHNAGNYIFYVYGESVSHFQQLYVRPRFDDYQCMILTWY